MAGDIRTLPRRLLLLANVLAASVSALFWILLFLAPGAFSQDAAAASDHELATDIRSRAGPQGAALFGLALLLLNFLYMLYGRRATQLARHVHSVSPDGPVEVACDVVEQALRRSGEALEEIAKLRIVVEPTPKRVLVRAQFQAPDGVPIHEVSQRLRASLSARFAELVTLPSGARVEFAIEFMGFSGRVARRESPAEPAETEERSPFTGPEYPIDEEDDAAHGGAGR